MQTLYEYYNIYKHNQALLDILEGFSANLEVGIERLKAREELFQLGENGQNEALDSIERDFRNAKNWLLANDKNLRSKWTALEAADKLKDLDDRLTKGEISTTLADSSIPFADGVVSQRSRARCAVPSSPRFKTPAMGS